MSCPLGCKTIINVDNKSLSLLNAYTACQHYEACPEALVSCEKCNLGIKRKYKGYLGTHKLDCRKLRCLKCNARVDEEFIEDHECEGTGVQSAEKQGELRDDKSTSFIIFG